jgi:predicted metal-dependent hydrolase
LRVVVGAVTKVALTGGRLVVAAPVSSAAAVRRAVVTWYRHHAAERLPERAAIWAKKIGVPLPLGRVMPDYEARRERLCRVGRRFEW